MPKAPRGKRVVDAATGAFTVVNKAPNGEADPYFDKTRGVWVAPWRKPNGKVGRPTGRTRALAIASRDRHIAKAADEAKFASSPVGGFTAESTVGELTEWWLQNIARHRVRATTFATYRKQLRLVDEGLGSVPARELRPEQVASFVSDLIDRGSASRARNIRTLLVQVMDQAVELGLATENVAKRVRTPKVPNVKRRTVTPEETRRLLIASDPRFAAAVALCYVQGWRVSEALGLAWQDIDLETGSVSLRRGATYADGVGMVLGPTKTERTAGVQMIGQTVIALLEARRKVQNEDREKLGEAWPTIEYDGEQLDLVFTAANGNPMLRQKVDKAIRTAAEKAGVDPTGLGTHAGRRSVVTNLFASGSLDLEDVARFVGHTDTATTRGYVQHEGDRPRQISEKALELLDPNWSGGELNTGASTPSRTSIAGLVARLDLDEHGDPDWTEIRAFADWIDHHPEEAIASITTPPVRTGLPRLDNLVAAIAETIADTHDVEPPVWCSAVDALDDFWLPPGTESMRARHASDVPPRFADRNIRLPVGTVWRSRATVEP